MKVRSLWQWTGLALAVAVPIGIGIVFLINASLREREAIRIYGNVEIREVRLAFEESGRIARMSVKEGEAVRPGAQLAHLEKTRFRKHVEQAEAAASVAKHELAKLLNGSRKEEIARAKARVREAAAKLADARKHRKRMDALAKTEFVPKERQDRAETAFKTAKARLEAARQTLKLTVKGPRQETIAAARSQVKAKSAELELARERLDDATLNAPTNGIIRNRLLEPGDLASPRKPVFTLALTDPVWIRAYIPEPWLGKVQPGMVVRVRTDSFPEKAYKGRIGWISPTAEFTPKQVQTEELRTKLVYQLRIFVDNPEQELRLGMPATVVIPLPQSGASGAKEGTQANRKTQPRNAGANYDEPHATQASVEEP